VQLTEMWSARVMMRCVLGTGP